MLSTELRQRLIKMMKENPKEAIKTIEEEPKLLEILLTSDDKLEEERNEKIKYINMTQQMDAQLQETAKRLKTTQGVLIGAGILWLLSQLNKK